MVKLCPPMEEFIALLAGFGAVMPFILFADVLVRRGVVEPTPSLNAAVLVGASFVMTVVTLRLKGSITWDGDQGSQEVSG